MLSRIRYTHGRVAAALTLLMLTQGHDSRSQQAPRAETPHYAQYLLYESPDLRTQFHRHSKNGVLQERTFLLVDGKLEQARELPTNGCPTIEAALTKHALKGVGLLRQIRIIQADRILQSHLPNSLDSGERAAVLSAKLVPGDVIIVTWQR